MIGSILEVGAISVFVFLVLAELPPDISIFLLSGVFICQFAFDAFYTKKVCCGLDCKIKRNTNYSDLDDSSQGPEQNGGLSPEDANTAATTSVKQLGGLHKCLDILKSLLENKTVKILALCLQVSSMVVFIAMWCTVFMSYENTHLTLTYKIRPMIAMPICLLVLSFLWTHKYQEWITKVNKRFTGDNQTARYKSSKCKMLTNIIYITFHVYSLFGNQL